MEKCAGESVVWWGEGTVDWVEEGAWVVEWVEWTGDMGETGERASAREDGDVGVE